MQCERFLVEPDDYKSFARQPATTKERGWRANRQTEMHVRVAVMPPMMDDVAGHEATEASRMDYVAVGFARLVAAEAARFVREGYKAVAVTIGTSVVPSCPDDFDTPPKQYFGRNNRPIATPTAQGDASRSDLFAERVYHALIESANSHQLAQVCVSIAVGRLWEVISGDLPCKSGINWTEGVTVLIEVNPDRRQDSLAEAAEHQPLIICLVAA